MITFEVTPDDGEKFKVVARARDVLVWEEAGPNRAAADLSGRPKLADLYALAHIAGRRQGLVECSLKEFKASHDVIAVPDEDGEEPDPTR